MNTKDKFLHGAMILTLAGLAVKVLGSVNRILLSRLLDGEGIGLYQIAYPVYLLLLAVSAAGVPIALSIIVSRYWAQGDHASVRRVFHVSVRLMAGVGVTLALLLAGAALWLVASGIIKDGRALYALLALTPAIIFASVLASFRGFFQGLQLMKPPAISQIAEQFIRVSFMLALAYIFLPYGLEYAAAGAAFGAVPGSITGIIVLGYFYRRYRHLWQGDGNVRAQEELKASTVIKELLLLALPVSLANILVPVTSSIDALLVPKYLLDAGFAVEEATTLYGYLAGMAQPLLLMATIPTMSLATSLVPAISEARILSDMGAVRSKAQSALKLCLLVVAPATLGLAVLAEPISLLLYGTAKPALVILHAAPAILFLGLQQVTTGILQGLGQTSLPMYTMAVGLVAKLVVLGALVTSSYNIVGAAWATNFNFAVMVLLNMAALHYYQLDFAWGKYVKILLAAGVMACVVHFAYLCSVACVGKLVATAFCILVAVAVYFALMGIFRILTKEEMRMLPVVKKFVK